MILLSTQVAAHEAGRQPVRAAAQCACEQYKRKLGRYPQVRFERWRYAVACRHRCATATFCSSLSGSRQISLHVGGREGFRRDLADPPHLKPPLLYRVLDILASCDDEVYVETSKSDE